MQIRAFHNRRPHLQGMASAVALAAVTIPTGAAAAEDAGKTAVDDRTIIVTGTQLKSEASVSRNSLGEKEQARSIQIYDAELIEQVKPEGLEDVVALSSNVTFNGPGDGRETSFVMRGFSFPPVLRDGFRVETFGGVSDPEIFNLESIEVLKGPDSILYGESNPGGVINLRTKRPLDQGRTLLSLEVGTDFSISPRFDINRSYGDVAFRVVGLYSYDETFRDYDNANKKYSLVPTFRWDAGTGTVVTLLGEFVYEDMHADFGTAIDNEGRPTAPPGQVNNHPQDTLERHFYSAGIDVEQRLFDGLTAEARVRYFDAAYDYSPLFLPFAYDPATKIYTRFAADQDNSNKEWAAQFNLFGDFSFGDLRDRFTLGVDYRDSDTFGRTNYDTSVPILLDWSNPDYSQVPPAADEIPIFPGFGDKVERIGFFLQNHLDLTDRLIVSAGVRYDKVDSTPAEGSYTGPYKADNTSLQIGAIYRLSDAISIFSNYSESFKPNSARDAANNTLPPETGEGWEIGIKGRLFEGRLNYTAAYFDISKLNVSIPDPLVPFASLAAGKQSSKGAEFDISGQITDRWSLILSGGILDTTDENGFEIQGVSDFTSAMFTTYRFNDNWSASLGYEYVGGRVAVNDPDFDGSDADRITLSSHFLLNAAVNYKAGPFGAQLNLTNLTDERYIDAAAYSNARSVYPGAPFQALLTLSYEM